MTDDTKKKKDEKPTATDAKKDKMPSAGPHADPRRMNPDATPGSGAIAPVGGTDDPNIQPTS